MSSDSKIEDKSPARKKKAAKKAPAKKKSASKKTAAKKVPAKPRTSKAPSPDQAGPPAEEAPRKAASNPGAETAPRSESRESNSPGTAARHEPVQNHGQPRGDGRNEGYAEQREQREQRERSDDQNRGPDQDSGRRRDGGGGGGGGKGRRRRGGPVRGRVRGKSRRRGGGNDNQRHKERDYDNQRHKDRDYDNSNEHEERRSQQLTGDPVKVDGMLELAPKGFGFLRRPEKDFEQSRDDVFLPPELVRKEGLRVGMWVHGLAREGNRGPQLVEVTSINGLKPDKARELPFFEELKATNPVKRIPFETVPDRFTTRVLDIISPIGRGQRGLIVSPPRSGKTTLLLHLAQAVRDRYSESLHLMILLADERPEEVTEFKRQVPEAEIYASSNDMPAKNHCRLAELCIERAKRLVEAGRDVFLVLDSITRLARAYNTTMRGGKSRGYQSGGIVAGALEMPRRLFAAARNTKEAGSLTIIGTALVQTNAKADEAIFQEFKGTGNMELVLDRKVAEHFVYPAVDIFKSGTRREELLLPEHMLQKIHLIRRGLSGHKPLEAMERLLFFLKKFPNNAQMLLEIKG